MWDDQDVVVVAAPSQTARNRPSLGEPTVSPLNASRLSGIRTPYSYSILARAGAVETPLANDRGTGYKGSEE